MATNVGTMRSNIATALNGFTALAGKVGQAGAQHDCWLLSVSGASKVFVVYAGFQREGPELIGAPYFTPGRYQFDICVVSQSFLDATTAYSAAGKADELVEAVRAIRGVAIGPAADTAARLDLVSESVVDSPERTDRGGGQVMVVCRYETSLTIA